jgi:hypothetical protein
MSEHKATIADMEPHGGQEGCTLAGSFHVFSSQINPN